MDKEKKFEYTTKNHEIKEEDIIGEEALAYGVKKPGEYTLEDYYALPDDMRVELIDGVFYNMASPLSVHQDLIGYIYFRIRTYISRKKGRCFPFLSPLDVQLDCDEKTMVQPDVVIICDRDKIIRRGVYGAPDFVVEILSPSTSRKDSVIKLRKYKEAGVKEYWMVDPDKKKIIVYDWSKSDIPKVYGFNAKVPIGIFDGDCEIDFAEIYRQIEWLYAKE